MNRKVFVVGAVALGVLLFFVSRMAFKSEPQTPATPSATTATGSASFVRPHSPVFGNSLARVTVVEWFDPECEACRAFHPVVKKIVEDYKDRVRFVMRYMPYHANSLLASSALMEAQEAQKFEEALDLLFEKQPEWADHQAPRPELIAVHLVSLGISPDKLESATLLAKHTEKVRMDEADGNAVGVRGTPTFFVNEQMVAELGEKPLRDAIDQALSSTTTP